MSDFVTADSQPSQRSADRHARVFGKLSSVYLLLLVYGTLFPLTSWDWHRTVLDHFIPLSWPSQVSRSDIIVNLAVYLPLGLLLMLGWRRRVSAGTAIILTTLCGVALSLGLEYLQNYIPQRVPSLLDTALNGSGTLIGALAANYLKLHLFYGGGVRRLREHWFVSGPLADIGLLVLALWLLAQLLPLIPSLDRGNLAEGLRPLLQTLKQLSSTFNLTQALAQVCTVAGLGLLTATLLTPGYRLVRYFGVVVLAVLFLQIPVVGRQLSLEALIGSVGGLLVLPLLIALPKKTWALLASLLLLLAYTLAQLRTDPYPNVTLHAFNWLPFRDHQHQPGALNDLIAALWPFAALAYLSLLRQPRRGVMLAGGIAVFTYTLGLQYLQTRIPGLHPDITDVILALLGWSLPWLLQVHGGHNKKMTETPPHPRLSPRAALLSFSVIAVSLLTIWGFMPARENPVEGRSLAHLPKTGELTAVHLPYFRQAHPRLPAPSTQDIETLRERNPQYIKQQLRHADNGHLNPAILMAYIEPGSQNLAALHQTLMNLKYIARGHDQTKPVAMAYDWLYDQWSESQRAQLRGKLAEGCEYEIRFIREQRLSPYNVYLYNSPFQALMACAIALYGDDPRGEAVMAFTQDYWKNRILPVWRQVMGRNGGWHEGGEYVGIGIGDAVYQLPAMWRKATGEDLFASEPGLRGFLDFLVYRTRPDGTYFRWGDAAFFDRAVPDQWALAAEYQHAPSFSLRPPPKGPVPSSWPWGPLVDRTMSNPAALTRLPLAQFFDGIGLLSARSDWGPDATYVDFKAGDNYWSHSHLDQGAFTIYKGGALAIDSGLYGPNYGADHHMNYTYQTIAHNTLTVTDPADTVPIPPRGKNEARHIANDGGQRRIGSGWGADPAPLDVAEWQAKRELYHTGHIENLLIDDGLNVAIADITPAYTNRYSGSGSFSQRTRRVENFRRVFAYDRIDDVIIVFDTVRATQAQFRKRWLLHSLEKPALTPDGFTLRVAARDGAGHAGGNLEGHVLLPAQHTLKLVGGEGHAFEVDGYNYDEGVQAKLARRKDAEPGQWRIELSPAADQLEDHFLVVMLPSLAGQIPRHEITRLEGNKPDEIGIEISGAARVTRWFFSPAGTSLRVEVRDEQGSRVHQLKNISAAAAAP